MTTLTLHNSPWNGTIAAPPSKSAAHRMLIAAALAGADEDAVTIPGTPSEDITATRNCLKALLAKGDNDTPALLDCGESGSTLRFLVPVAAALGRKATFVGHGRLPGRPMCALTDTMSQHGAIFSAHSLPFTLEGALEAGEYRLSGNISSQYLTGLLFALPLLKAPSRILLTTPLESAGYIDLTLQVLQRFGITIQRQGQEFLVPGGLHYRLPAPPPLAVEGDWSNGAFPLCAGALAGNGVTVEGLLADSCQGDRAIAKLLADFGAKVESTEDCCRVAPGALHAQTIDVRPIPDLVPVLAVVAALAQGTTRFINGQRLRLKESDRLESTCRLINALGGKAAVLPDDVLEVTGVSNLTGGEVDSAGDHRIVMAAAVAAVRCQNPVVIHGANAVDKSWPDFFLLRQKLLPQA